MFLPFYMVFTEKTALYKGGKWIESSFYPLLPVASVNA